MAEGTRLESAHTRKGIGGSNPSLSAIFTSYRPYAHPDSGNPVRISNNSEHGDVNHIDSKHFVAMYLASKADIPEMVMGVQNPSLSATLLHLGSMV